MKLQSSVFEIAALFQSAVYYVQTCYTDVTAKGNVNSDT